MAIRAVSGIETLEDRRLLTTNVYFDNVTNQMTIVDDFADDRLQTTSRNSSFPMRTTFRKTTMSPCRMASTLIGVRITDPLGCQREFRSTERSK